MLQIYRPRILRWIVDALLGNLNQMLLAHLKHPKSMLQYGQIVGAIIIFTPESQTAVKKGTHYSREKASSRPDYLWDAEEQTDFVRLLTCLFQSSQEN